MARRQIKANESRAQARRSDQGRSGQIARTRMHIATATGMRIATTEEQIRADQGRSRRPESRPGQIATTIGQIRADRNNQKADQGRTQQPECRASQTRADRKQDTKRQIRADRSNQRDRSEPGDFGTEAGRWSGGVLPEAPGDF